MSTATQAAARQLRDLAMQALAVERLAALGLPVAAGEVEAFVIDGVSEPLRCERRGDAFAASLELDDDYETAERALAALFGRPVKAGPDPTGVRWVGYSPAQSFALVLLVEHGDTAVLHLEPYARGKPFIGLEPDVASWFAARSTAASRPASEAAAARAARRAVRKASAGPKPGGRLSAERTKALAAWLAELGAAPIDRAAIDRFAAAHALVLDDDHAFAGRTYLAPELATRIQVDVNAVHVMTIVAQSEGDSAAEDALAAAAHDRRHAAIRADVVAALGEPTATGRRTYISTERWEMWRLAEAVLALVTGLDPRGDGGHATALRLIAWPHDHALPGFTRGVTDWIDQQLTAARAGRRAR